MEIVKLGFILVLIMSNIICEKMDTDRWREGIGKNKWSNSEVIRDILTRMTRKPRQRQYLGLMRRKGSEKSQTARKRHKFQTFVGLMGKRSFDVKGGL
ncbi:protachykinin [Melanotaenia boesemani]|uniref:protachykinin n=1 Tax=Melanotaenia boesemani TaxID=1250792 RepID=UPI001C04321D|nr:protachykinin [Melanotaenia boesemani]